MQMTGRLINTDGGIKEIPVADPLFKKQYYVTVTPKGKDSRFVREAYFTLDRKQNFVSIHYMSDHTKAMHFSHGNAKCDKPFIRTCPSVIGAAKKSEELPSNVYRHLVSEPGHSSDLHPVLIPRNFKQIRNAQVSQ